MKLKKVIFGIELATEYADKKMLNGYAPIGIDEIIEELRKDDKLKNKLLSTSIKGKLVYNEPNDTLYLVTFIMFNEHFDVNDEIVLKKILIDNYYKNEYSLLEPNNEVLLSSLPEENLIYRVENSLSAKGFVILQEMMKTEKDLLMYTDFMTNPIIFKHLKKICKDNHFPFKEEEVTNSLMLPVHRKDPMTGVVYLFKKVPQLYRQFQLAQNFLIGFEKSSPEHEIGKLMMLRPDTFGFDVWNLITSSKPDNDIKLYKIEKFAKRCEKRHPLLDEEIEELEQSLQK